MRGHNYKNFAKHSLFTFNINLVRSFYKMDWFTDEKESQEREWGETMKCVTFTK